jgi:acyl-CoA synthetase (AMP-forming)/AMP-acid ligase II
MDLAGQAWQGWMRTGGLARLDRGGGRLEIRDRERGNCIKYKRNFIYCD